jgi:uncharacterized protein (DUF849 family)
MNRKTILCCAITGSSDTVRLNPAVPVTPEQIARSAVEAVDAGAAIVHIHVRDPDTGKASMDLALYEETVSRIRNSGRDVIINLTTGAGGRFNPGLEDPRQGAIGSTLSSPAKRTAHVLKLRPEICSLDMGSLNMGDFVFINTPPHLTEMAAAVQEIGVRPELEVFEAGHIRLARSMLDRGVLKTPPLFQICLGVTWGQPATPDAMGYMQRLLPNDATWFAFGVGAGQFPMAALAPQLGGHVRVGLEDNLYLEKGVLAPSNAALVEKAAKIVRMIGSDIASTSEARTLLGLSA